MPHGETADQNQKSTGRDQKVTKHIPVLLHEVLTALAIAPSDTVVDGTLGGGGHGREILLRLEKDGVYIGIDADQGALDRFNSSQHKNEASIHLVHANVRELNQILVSLKISSIDKVLLDLGLSSDQLDSPERGFSFQKEGPLEMTLADSSVAHPLRAEEIVNEWEEESLSDVIFGYGEERFARKIAKRIVEAREHRITTTTELATIVASAIPKHFWKRGVHPATKTFQALRIAVNDELGSLKLALDSAYAHLNIGGRIAVISFHSLEDRIVKRFFHEQVTTGMARLLMKKPTIPSRDEVARNPRSRSAKLRAIEKIEQ